MCVPHDPLVCTQMSVSVLSASKSPGAGEQGKNTSPLNYLNADLYQGPAFLCGQRPPVNTEHGVYFKYNSSAL